MVRPSLRPRACKVNHVIPLVAAGNPLDFPRPLHVLGVEEMDVVQEVPVLVYAPEYKEKLADECQRVVYARHRLVVVERIDIVV